MSYEVFYSLRLSEGLDFIEVNNNKRQDEHDLNCMYYGQICATIANFSQGKKRKKFKATDFFKTKKKKTAIKSVDEQANYLLMLTMALGGSVEGW
jgi:hypothetical protein